MASETLEKELTDLNLKNGGDFAEVGGESAEVGGDSAENKVDSTKVGGESAECKGDSSEVGGESEKVGDELEEAGDESEEVGRGFVVCEGNKVEEFKISRSDVTRFSEFILEERLEKWNYKLKVSILKPAENNWVSIVRISLLPNEDIEEKKQLELSDIPLILYQQLSDTPKFVDFFYNFKEPLRGEFPQSFEPDFNQDIHITIKTIPYIESTNGTCQLNINQTEFYRSKSEYHYRLGKHYYLLTSAEGYLVRITVIYRSKEVYARVRFIAGPYDEKLSYHFPHSFSATLKHKDDAELDLHVGPVVKEFEQSEKGEWSCTYRCDIATYKEIKKKFLNNDKLLVRFCIAPLPVD